MSRLAFVARGGRPAPGVDHLRQPCLVVGYRRSVAVIERADSTEYITPDRKDCRSTRVRWCGAFEAWPKLMAFPIDYQWCMCSHVLNDCELCVSAIDNRETELFTCVQVSHTGLEQGCHKRAPSRFKIDVLESATELRAWRPLLAQAGSAPQ
jgi:hypothetical protein